MELHYICKEKEGQNCNIFWKNCGKVFWDAKGYILVDFLSRKETVSAICSVQTLKKL
jgi:hypothetical protein